MKSEEIQDGIQPLVLFNLVYDYVMKTSVRDMVIGISWIGGRKGLELDLID